MSGLPGIWTVLKHSSSTYTSFMLLPCVLQNTSKIGLAEGDWFVEVKARPISITWAWFAAPVRGMNTVSYHSRSMAMTKLVSIWAQATSEGHTCGGNKGSDDVDRPTSVTHTFGIHGQGMRSATHYWHMWIRNTIRIGRISKRRGYERRPVQWRRLGDVVNQ